MNEHDALAEFDGMVRLFPLPGLVFFPHVAQPLHIFEPRYRQMTADALAGDRLIALVLPRPGWEPDYAGRPAIHAVATLGRIVADQKLEDGRYNLLLRGLCRVRIVEEIASAKLYRQARVEVLEDVRPTMIARELYWRARLRQCVPTWVGEPGEVQQELRKLLDSDLPLGTLSDILSFALSLAPDCKQELLQERDVEARLARLFTFFDRESAAAVPRPKFPPDFSVN